jgi:hypothetical protein
MLVVMGRCGPRVGALREKPTGDGLGGGTADLPVVATAVISEAVHSRSAAVSEDAPRRVMPSAAVSGTLGRGILLVASTAVSETLGGGFQRAHRSAVHLVTISFLK